MMVGRLCVFTRVDHPAFQIGEWAIIVGTSVDGPVLTSIDRPGVEGVDDGRSFEFVRNGRRGPWYSLGNGIFARAVGGGPQVAVYERRILLYVCSSLPSDNRLVGRYGCDPEKVAAARRAIDGLLPAAPDDMRAGT